MTLSAITRMFSLGFCSVLFKAAQCLDYLPSRSPRPSVCFLYNKEFRKKGPSAAFPCSSHPPPLYPVLPLQANLAAAAPSVAFQVVYTVLCCCNYVILHCGVWLSTEIQLLIFLTTFSSASHHLSSLTCVSSWVCTAFQGFQD